MELTVDIGEGLCPGVDANRPADAPIGLVPVDALYSPVRQVSYKVENDPCRPGARLRQADASRSKPTARVTPDDALAYAEPSILQDQLALFVNFEEPMRDALVRPGPEPAPTMPLGGAEPRSTIPPQLNRYLLKKVDELELSVRSAPTA